MVFGEPGGSVGRFCKRIACFGGFSAVHILELRRIWDWRHVFVFCEVGGENRNFSDEFIVFRGVLVFGVFQFRIFLNSLLLHILIFFLFQNLLYFHRFLIIELFDI